MRMYLPLDVQPYLNALYKLRIRYDGKFTTQINCYTIFFLFVLVHAGNIIRKGIDIFICITFKNVYYLFYFCL